MRIQVTAWIRTGDRTGPKRELEILESTAIRPAEDWLKGHLLVLELHDACERLGERLAQDQLPGARVIGSNK